MKNYIIVTNNPLVARVASPSNKLDFLAYFDALSVLEAVRGHIHAGHALATHPITSSLKPNETPYKSILLYGARAELCLTSLRLIEEATQLFEKFALQRPPRSLASLPPNILEDFATIDCDMVRQWL